jgi:hypothetical protein
LELSTLTALRRRALELSALTTGTLLLSTGTLLVAIHHTAAHEGRGALELSARTTLRRRAHVLATLTAGALLLSTGTLLVAIHHTATHEGRGTLELSARTTLRRRAHVLATLTAGALLITTTTARALAFGTLVVTGTAHERWRRALLLTILATLWRGTLELATGATRRTWRQITLGALRCIGAKATAL